MAEIRTKLRDLIEANRDRPFEWGQHDCALWAVTCRLELSGVDHGKFFRGKYSTARGAARRMKTFGVSSPVEVADRLLGDRAPIALARVGNVVAADLSRLGLLDGPNLGWALGICNGAQSFFVTETGLVSIETLSCEHCYHE